MRNEFIVYCYFFLKWIYLLIYVAIYLGNQRKSFLFYSGLQLRDMKDKVRRPDRADIKTLILRLATRDSNTELAFS